MNDWFTPELAALLMLSGVIPAVLNIYLLADERHKPGVFWFLASMALGGLWALLFAGFTLVKDPGMTLAIANFFWVVPPAASVSMLLLAFEYVSSRPAPRWLVAGLLVPIVLLFLLSWGNPSNLVFTDAYYVDAAGILHFPQFDGPVKVLVVKGYGYLLFTIAAGMLLGEVIRSQDHRRLEAGYILLVFSVLSLSTLVKVANLVPIYFDPTTVVFSLSGLAFAVSTHRSGFLKFVTIAREQAFEQVEDAILIADTDGVIVDANRVAVDLFGEDVYRRSIDSVLGSGGAAKGTEDDPLELLHGDTRRYYSVRRSSVRHFRDSEGTVIVLTDITPVKNRERDLDLFKQVLTRIFRHNLRNDLTVIRGYSEMLVDRTDGDARENAARIAEVTDRLIVKTNKAKEIEQIFTEEQQLTQSLSEAVVHAIDDIDEVLSDAELTLRVTDYTVRAHPRLWLAIRELLDNAVVHGDHQGAPVVEVFTRQTADHVTLFVENAGEGIPHAELSVLDAEVETDLEHGSGIGLWLVHWIVKRSNGTLVTESEEGCARIGLRFSRQDASEP